MWNVHRLESAWAEMQETPPHKQPALPSTPVYGCKRGCWQATHFHQSLLPSSPSSPSSPRPQAGSTRQLGSPPPLQTRPVRPQDTPERCFDFVDFQLATPVLAASRRGHSGGSTELRGWFGDHNGDTGTTGRHWEVRLDMNTACCCQAPFPF